MSKCLVIALVSTLFLLVINSKVVKRSVCKENEMHVECVHCGPKTCDDLGFPSPCGGATALCRPECVCIDGRVRDANGTCIPKKECPGCGNDRNATSGCGNHCGNSCSDHMELNKTCLTGCRYNSCDCRTGYVHNDAIGKCVLPVDCFSSSPKEILVNNSEENKCITKLHSCSIKMGPQGLQGQQGPQGPQGPEGEMGNSGLPGEPGQKGLDGTPGLEGDKGDEGSKGLKGEFGEKGEKGEEGPPGQKGDRGVGLPGRHGFSSCSPDGDETDDFVLPEVIHTCMIPEEETVTGKNNIYESDQFEVMCDNMEKNRTCIHLKDRANSSIIDSASITHTNKPFWASEIGLDLSKLYGVTVNQLEWLISQSKFTSLEITYHCKNSYIIYEDKDLRLMSWKKAVIGPRRSENSPYFFDVSTENDGCKVSGDYKTEWRQSTIQIKSHLKILPVTDFYIRDIREGEEQKFYLELKELCFNF